MRISSNLLRPALAIVVSASVALTLGATSSSAARQARVDTSVPVVVGDAFLPTTYLREAHQVTRELTPGSAGTYTIHWRGANRFRSIAKYPGSSAYTMDHSRGTTVAGTGYPARLTGASLSRREHTISPDGYDYFAGEVLGFVFPLITKQRQGTATFAYVDVNGRTLLRASMPISANECAGLPAGTRTVDIDPETFLPVRLLEIRRNKVTRSLAMTNRAARTSDFAPVHTVGKGFVSDSGFVRRFPVAAAKVSPFVVSMPTALPAGFRFDFSGTAARGQMVGPEASFERSTGLFAARWSRGIEPLELTIRKARGTLTRDWDQSSPFGVECGASDDSSVMVGTRPGNYSVGEFGSANLWWRTGTTLYTLSGPFSSAQLINIATSLQPVSAE